MRKLACKKRIAKAVGQKIMMKQKDEDTCPNDSLNKKNSFMTFYKI